MAYSWLMSKTIWIEIGYRSDHSCVVLQLRFCQYQRGRGLWKFNNSLVRDKQYVVIVKETITKPKCQYAVHVYNLENISNISNKNIQLTINDQLFLETLLMEIRGKIISYENRKYTRD